MFFKSPRKRIKDNNNMTEITIIAIIALATLGAIAYIFGRNRRPDGTEEPIVIGEGDCTTCTPESPRCEQALQFVKEGDQIRIVNHDSFTDTIEYDITYDTLHIDGETLLNVAARLRRDTPWAKAGFAVSSEQFVLQPYAFPSELADKAGKVQKQDGNIVVTTDRGSVTIFTLVDRTIDLARQQGLKIVPLWFGVWKNSMSCYAPAWFKRDVKRFPRALTAEGKPLEIASWQDFSSS